MSQFSRLRAFLVDRSTAWVTATKAWGTAAAFLTVLLAGALLTGSGSGESDPIAAVAGTYAASPRGADGPVERALRPAATRIAQALHDPAKVDPELFAEVTSIESTTSGWLLLVGSDQLYPQDARAVCEALAAAEALPKSLVFVTDPRRQLLSGC